MMELQCALVLISAGLVCSTPHGYGVKSGALANAQATAGAGAFAGLGQPTSPGGAFSGSFSKSSSSSFAASSASASSSSFSYSGSGASGQPGGGGCGTGACPNGAAADGGANAAAGSAAVAGALQYNKDGTPCAGNCPNQTPCASGNCPNQTPCTSGNCAGNQPGHPLTDYNNDDIHVGPGDAKNSYTPNSAPAFNNKPTGYPGSGCASGNCGQPAPSQTKPTYAPGAGDSYPGQLQPPKCDSPNCKEYQPGTAPSAGAAPGLPYNKPSTFLSAPKESPAHGSKCTSPNCGSPDINSYPPNSPSSYNVPIHGAYPGSAPQASGPPNCSSGNCATNNFDSSNSASNSNSISNNYLTASHEPNSPNHGVDKPKCNTPECEMRTLQKDYPNFVPLNKGAPNCPSGNCGPSLSILPGFTELCWFSITCSSF
ncbi:hypothetical protein JYU34_003491 [Plutella xylostella]|uniref:Uncharacterized protein n=1 Tax=Plutella xylostella TaxID=51655 RepID=A0ABQ7R071_PLUXY|nr:hypothetical protein JYU34_003491 [Plutella xylostella]